MARAEGPLSEMEQRVRFAVCSALLIGFVIGCMFATYVTWLVMR